MSWRIVTNGKTYRLEHYDELSVSSYFYSEQCAWPGIPIPKDFCLGDARIKLAQLKQKDNDNTWVEVK